VFCIAKIEAVICLQSNIFVLGLTVWARCHAWDCLWHEKVDYRHSRSSDEATKPLVICW